MKQLYKSEIEAMRDFYEELGIKPDYSCNTDGRVDGTLVEFKLNDSGGYPINQLMCYIKSLNSVAKILPRFSLLVNVNQRKYVFFDNSNWKRISNGSWKFPQDLLKFLNKKDYMKGWIDECSIISYNDLFYSNHISVKKEDFIEEVKNPKELNIEQYRWDDKGDMERSILDCLGGSELKKRLGAFFTPDEYVRISTEYVRNTISRVPVGYDYIILDRCAGTGNLEKFFTDEELSHCVLNTFVYAEWTTLKGLYEGRARVVIPHTKDYKDVDGLLSDGNTLTKSFDDAITKIINEQREKSDRKLIVIGLENPPYRDETTNIKNSKASTSNITKSHTYEVLMKTHGSLKARDLSNQFIFSMLKYADEYIIYSPIKYWKSQHIFDEIFNEGYICNRDKFHASEAAVCLISWSIQKNHRSVFADGKPQKSVNNTHLDMKSDLGKRRVFKLKNPGHNDLLDKNKNSELGLMMSQATVLNAQSGHLCNIRRGDSHVSYTGLNRSNILNQIPLFVANHYKPKDYTEKEIVMKSGDCGLEYQKDKDFLDDCFVWVCLSNSNHCESNEHIRNELCLSQNTKSDDIIDINSRNTKLIEGWNEIIEEIKKTDEYKSEYTYGLNQIIKEINIKIETGDFNKIGEPILAPKYINLNEMIRDFKKELNLFYEKYITEKIFKYELLK